MSIDTSRMNALISELNAGRVAASGGVTKTNADDGTKVSFADALQKAIENVNSAQDKAHDMVNDYISGKSDVPLHEVLITSQKADIAFQELVKTKEKLLAAYRDVMGMSV